MKNKTLRIFLILFLALSFTGCQTQANPIEEIDFNMEFKQLDLENNTAEFVVDGYPNSKEFEEVSTAIIDSLEAQDIKKDTPIQVYVYSSFDQEEDTPFFGEATYKNGEITQNDLTNNKEENFLELVSN